MPELKSLFSSELNENHFLVKRGKGRVGGGGGGGGGEVGGEGAECPEKTPNDMPQKKTLTKAPKFKCQTRHNQYAWTHTLTLAADWENGGSVGQGKRLNSEFWSRKKTPTAMTSLKNRGSCSLIHSVAAVGSNPWSVYTAEIRDTPPFSIWRQP